MNDDYLWDKSGEPDPEIQQLEEILGTLRYQPKPFEIPGDVPAPRRRSYFPLLAIAATAVGSAACGRHLASSAFAKRVRNQQARRRSRAAAVEEKPVATTEPEKKQVAS